MLMITLQDSCDTIEEVLLSLQSSSKKLFQWLSDNQMKSNAARCHLIMSRNESVDFQLTWWLTYRKKLL